MKAMRDNDGADFADGKKLVDALTVCVCAFIGAVIVLMAISGVFHSR